MAVQDKILEKSHELFVKKGIRSVTMDEIAQSLGMSKRTLYEQFEDKKTLVKHDANRFTQMMKAKTDSIMNDADNAIQGITNVMQFVKGMLLTVTPLYFMDMRRFYPTAYEEIIDTRAGRKLDISNRLIRRGIEQGVFRSDLNTELVAHFINEVIMSDHDALCELAMCYGDFERDVLFAYLTGIATEKGREIVKSESEAYFRQMNRYGSEIPRFKF